MGNAEHRAIAWLAAYHNKRIKAGETPIHTIRALDFPCYARSSILYAGTTSNICKTKIPITCGGVTINPGDVVFGNDNGLVIATSGEFGNAVPIAEEIQRKEGVMLGKMAEGASLMEMLNFETHCASLEAGEASRLEFTV